ncbi:hypothetical protein NDU88_006616 [Pleurodeles waltl]|uniref:KIAA1549 n=1 Tax=Pleurodeles waltl TaxID=8319 RepID=A0AAV7SQ62_PLEWA|nr:hypothetical protein NDU88_006616 [Pleurodeles waltl]
MKYSTPCLVTLDHRGCRARRTEEKKSTDPLTMENNETLSFGPIIQQSRTTPKALNNTTVERPDNNTHSAFLPSVTPPLPDTTWLDLGITNNSTVDTIVSESPNTVSNEASLKNEELSNPASHLHLSSAWSPPVLVFDSVFQETTDVFLPVIMPSSSLVDINVDPLTSFSQGDTHVKSTTFVSDGTLLLLSHSETLYETLNPTSTSEDLTHYASQGEAFSALESLNSITFLPFEDSTVILPSVPWNLQSATTIVTQSSLSEKGSSFYSAKFVDSTFVKMVDSSSFTVTVEPTNAASATGIMPVLFSTSLPDVSSSALLEEVFVDPTHLFTSLVVPEIASSITPHLPDSSEMSSQVDIFAELVSPVPSVRPHTSCVHCDYTLVPPHVLSTESIEHDWGSDELETLSFTTSLLGSFTHPTSLITDMYEPEEPSSEVYNTAFPSRLVSLLSLHVIEASEGTTMFSNIYGTSMTSSIFTTSIPADIGSPLETLYDQMTINASLSGFESYYFIPTPTAQLSSGNVRVDIESTFTTSANTTESTAAFEETSLPEAPAFKHTESVIYLGTLTTVFSVDEASEVTDFVLSHSSKLYVLESDNLSFQMYTSSYSLTPSISSSLLPQVSPTVHATYELFGNYSSIISSGIFPTEIFSMDLSQYTPWQTSSLQFLQESEVTPKTSAAENWPTLDFYSRTTVLSDFTPILSKFPETLFTSTSSEASSSLETSFLSFPTTRSTMVLLTYTQPSLTSSGMLDEAVSTFSSTMLLPTETFISSLPAVPSFQTSKSFLISTIMPTVYSSHLPQTVVTTAQLKSSQYVQQTSTIDISTTPISSLIVGTSETKPPPKLPTSLPPPSTISASPSTISASPSTQAPTSPPVSGAPTLSTPPKPPINASSQASTTVETTKATPTSSLSTTSIVRTSGRTTSAPTSKFSTASTTVVVGTAPPTTTTTRQPLVCDINATDAYLVTAVLARTVGMEDIKLLIEELLSVQFSRSVELEVYTIHPAFTFLVISGPLVYTAIAVTNVIRVSSLHRGKDPTVLSVQPYFTAPDTKYQVQTVLQFVPLNMEVGFCNFTQRLERGLAVAFAEVRRLRQEIDDFTIQILNVTVGPIRTMLRKGPVNIVFAVREGIVFLNGSDASNLLRNLSTVEFSFYLGFPVQQVAEPFYYPQLNISQLLKDSWLQTVLLDVNEQKIQEDVFQAEMERKLALLVSEALLQGRRWKRASSAGSSTVQIVNVSRLEGSDNPAALIYFVEDGHGERLEAAKAADLINIVNIQRAAIILGYRIQGVLAQPVNMVQEAPKDSRNLLIIVGVVVPVCLVMIILVILYWKVCRSNKLEFQPDTMSNIQQRQKLQAPTVKGFDFAKQHLGQHNKDDVLIIHEPAPLPVPIKDATPSENGDVPTPKSKTSSKPCKSFRHRGRVTPSDAGSIASDQSSGKESAEETVKASAPPQESKPRKAAKSGVLQTSSGNEQHSSAIFEHVDRVSHSPDVSRRFPSKIQLIAMQPIPARPMHNFVITDRVTETNKINKEIQTALRHKSEIEHHRNKIRLRAKRKGHYEFPAVDLIGLTDTRERHKMYRKAQMQIDKILDPGGNSSPVFIESRKSSRSKRSPKQRRRHQINGSPPDVEKDRLITTDSDGTYKRPPGVSNSAYISDADLVVEPPTPTSCTDLGKFPGSSLHAPTPSQYLPPQPSIEEARQTMHSLLDDAFALVTPTCQTAGPTTTTLPGAIMGQPVTSTPARAERENVQWASSYVHNQAINTPFARYVEFGIPPSSTPSLLPRPGYGQGFMPSTAQDHHHQQQSEVKHSSRAMYTEEMPSVARPRPIGGTAGPAQIQHLTQVGIASRLGAQISELPIGRTGHNQPGVPSWPSYQLEEDFPQSRDKMQVLGHQEYPPSPMFHVPRSSARQPSAPPDHLQHSSHHGPSLYYPGGSTEDLQPGHTSASLIKAIREELLRLSQKQTAVQNFHS